MNLLLFKTFIRSLDEQHKAAFFAQLEYGFDGVRHMYEGDDLDDDAQAQWEADIKFTGELVELTRG